MSEIDKALKRIERRLERLDRMIVDLDKAAEAGDHRLMIERLRSMRKVDSLPLPDEEDEDGTG